MPPWPGRKVLRELSRCWHPTMVPFITGTEIRIDGGTHRLILRPSDGPHRQAVRREPSFSRASDGGDDVGLIEHGGRRFVHSQYRSEIPARCGQPVCLRRGVFRLLVADRDRQRTVGVVDDSWSAVADRVSVDGGSPRGRSPAPSTSSATRRRSPAEWGRVLLCRCGFRSTARPDRRRRS